MGAERCFAQRQDFEEDFQLASFPAEFLPRWYGNEVSGGSSRIFQLAGQGRGGGKALAVQALSTFDAKIWVRLSPAEFENPELVFYAKSIRNGSGNRPVLLYYSWGESLDGTFSTPVQIGTDSEFPNENQEYRRFSLELPEALRSAEMAVLKLEVRYGPRSGTAARWVMDDFEFGDLVRDQTAPEVLEVKGYGEKSVLLGFSEKVDPVFAIFPIAYELNGRNPESVSLVQDSVAVLDFGESLEQGKVYSLALGQIPDLEGNFLRDTLVNFVFSDPTAFEAKSLVINELMPAPRADQDLPNAEYIELFHAGDREYRLAGLTLSNSRTSTQLGEYWLRPGEYLILAPEAQAAQFREFGKVLPVKNWPTLLNSGDVASLSSPVGLLIDRISYTTASWGGSEFASGGYSLEVVNPHFLCDNSGFLKASIDSRRGTPGSQNSVFDAESSRSAPVLEAGFFKDSLEIRLVFSEPILPALTADDFIFSPRLIVDRVEFAGGNEVRVLLQAPALASQPYELELSGLRDCFGSALAGLKARLVLAEIPQTGDLIINEVLFNPRTGEPKFVEIKNTGGRYLNLEGWSLANLGKDGKPDQGKVFGRAGTLLAPEGHLAVTTDAAALKLVYPKSAQGDVVQIPALPSYPIAGGVVVLLSAQGETVESFAYDEKMHHPLLRDPKGVSLERISPMTPAAVGMNWQSASGNEDYATPGRKNSQSISGEFEEEMIQIDPEVFDPLGSSGPSFASIRYEIGQSGWVGTFRIFSSSGQWVQTLAQNQVLGTSGLLTWAGTDASGKMAKPGYYVLLVELFEPGGRTKAVKKTIVVATQL